MSSSLSEIKRELETYQFKTLKQLILGEKNLQEQLARLIQKRKKLETELDASKSAGTEKEQFERLNEDIEAQDKIISSIRLELKKHAEKVNHYFEKHADPILEEGWDVLEKEEILEKPMIISNAKTTLMAFTEECMRLNRQDIIELIKGLFDISQRKIIFTKLQEDYAKNKDPFLGFLLSQCYEYGLGTPIDKKMAFELDTKLAEDNFPLGQTCLANSYFEGISQLLEKDPKKGMELCKQATKQKLFYRPYVRLAMRLSDENSDEYDINLAFKLLEEASAAGCSSADILLVDFYNNDDELRHKNCLTNKEAMFFHAKRASEAGNAVGYRILFLCYFKGWGADVNYGLAIEMLQKAASMKNDYAEDMLAVCYEAGTGEFLPKNSMMALTYYSRALKQGCEDSLGNFKRFVLENQKDQNIMDALHNLMNTFKRSSYLQDPIASFNLGFCYQQGIMVTKNLDKAIKLYQQAASLGITEASNELGKLCTSSEQTLLEPHQAKHFFDVAASEMENEDERGYFEENYVPLLTALENAFDGFSTPTPPSSLRRLIANYAFDNNVRRSNGAEQVNIFFKLYRIRFESEPKTDNDLSRIGDLVSDFAYALEEDEDKNKIQDGQDTSKGPST